MFDRAGFSDVRWLLPAESGFYQPIVIAKSGLNYGAVAAWLCKTRRFILTAVKAGLELGETFKDWHLLIGETIRHAPGRDLLRRIPGESVSAATRSPIEKPWTKRALSTPKTAAVSSGYWLAELAVR